MSLLSQARKMIDLKVNINPITITTTTYPTKTDPFDSTKTIPDYSATPIETNIRCRLSHENKGPFEITGNSVGMSTNLGRFVISNYQNPLTEGSLFTELGIQWRIGAVDTLKKFEGILGYQAPVYEAE